jgi:hypothetical protein
MTRRSIDFVPPSPVAIARQLCGMTPALASDIINYERCCLEQTFKFLSEDPPNLEDARAELAAGMDHAFRRIFPELDRPESWLVAACAHLLAVAPPR